MNLLNKIENLYTPFETPFQNLFTLLNTIGAFYVKIFSHYMS